jgi:hypothetical protein
MSAERKREREETREMMSKMSKKERREMREKSGSPKRAAPSHFKKWREAIAEYKRRTNEEFGLVKKDEKHYPHIKKIYEDMM